MKTVSIQVEGNHYVITEGDVVDGPYRSLGEVLVYALERALQNGADFKLDLDTIAEIVEIGGFDRFIREVL